MKKVKRALAVLLALLTVLLCACSGTAAPAADENGYADQDEFLQDMAEGIQKRLSSDKDSIDMSAEEKAAHYEELVGYELSRIEKYQDLHFADENFDRLAHLYISGCQAQRFAAQNYKNDALYESLWAGGKQIRFAVITELYTRYDLPITDDEAANYKLSDYSSYSASMDGQLDIASGLTLYSDQMVTYDEVIRIDKDESQTLYDDEDILITLKSLEITDGNYQVNFLIDNKRESERATCELGKGYVDDYQIGIAIPWGYCFIDPGKKGDTYSMINKSDLEDADMEAFETLSCYLYVLVSDGETGQYLAKIPMEIAREAFHE